MFIVGGEGGAGLLVLGWDGYVDEGEGSIRGDGRTGGCGGWAALESARPPFCFGKILSMS